jgi:Fe-S cluster biogenesis protein NfuA
MERTKEEIVKEIKTIIENNIQPNVAMHGGEIVFKDFDVDSGNVLVMLSGSCSGCSSSMVTLKLGVENMLKHYVKEVTGITGVDDPNFNDPYYTNYDTFQEEEYYSTDEYKKED